MYILTGELHSFETALYESILLQNRTTFQWSHSLHFNVEPCLGLGESQSHQKGAMNRSGPLSGFFRGGHAYDFIWSYPGFELLISERALEVLLENGCQGILTKEIEVDHSKCSKAFLRSGKKYYELMASSNLLLDRLKSNYMVSSVCPDCGFEVVEKKTKGLFFLNENDVSSDVCKVNEYPFFYIVSERFVEAILDLSPEGLVIGDASELLFGTRKMPTVK